MQNRDVERVRHVFVMLKPVAGHDRAAARADAAVVGFDKLARLEHFQAVVARQHGLLLRWAHIGKDQSVALLHRIPGLAHPIAFEPTFGLARLLEAAPLGVEQPAVIAAANPALLDATVIEGGAAMAAARLHQPRLAAPVTEQNEVFAQDADGLGRRAGIGDEPDRMPVAAQQFSHGLATPDFGQGGIVGRGLARIAGAGIDRLGRHVASPWHDVLLQPSMSLNLTKSNQTG